MNDPRLHFGCLPIVLGTSLILVGHQGVDSLLESLGLIALVGGVVVLVLTDRREQ